MNEQLKALPKLAYPFVDVRDCANAHIRALFQKESNGKRYIIANQTLLLEEIAKILEGEFSKYGYNIVTKRAEKCKMKFFSYFDSQASLIEPDIGRNYQVDSILSKKELNMTYKDAKSVIIEATYDFISKGFVKKNLLDAKHK